MKEFVLKCDICEAQYEDSREGTNFIEEDLDMIISRANDQGWDFDEEGYGFCPNCA